MSQFSPVQATGTPWRSSTQAVAPLPADLVADNARLAVTGYSYGGFGGNKTEADFGPLRGRSEFDATAVWAVQNLGFGNRARVRAADAGVGAAVAEYDLTTNRIRREVAEAVADARAAAAQFKPAEAAVAAAEEGYKLEVDRIKQGPGRPLELLDSFRQLLDSHQERLRAVVAFTTLFVLTRLATWPRTSMTGRCRRLRSRPRRPMNRCTSRTLRCLTR